MHIMNPLSWRIFITLYLVKITQITRISHCHTLWQYQGPSDLNWRLSTTTKLPLLLQ